MSDNNFFRISNINIPASSPLENENKPDAAVDDRQAFAGSAGVPDSIGSEDSQFNFGWPSGEDPFDSLHAVESSVSFIRNELAKPDPDESAMFQRLMSLTPDQGVAVLHELRTNGDIYRLLDDLFSNPKTASQMGQLSEKLKGVLSKYPGIQDIISEIDKRVSSLSDHFLSSEVTSSDALSALSDGAVDIGGAGGGAAPDLSGYGGFTTQEDPFADFQRGIDSTYSFIENEISKADPDEKAMLQKLLDLSPQQDVVVIHQLRTNNDVYRFLDEIFSNPSVRPQIQNFLDQLKSVVSTYPGIQDVISEIEKRMM